MTFRELHEQDNLFLLANVWDIPSIKVAEDLNLKAVGTSSFAISKMLGYPDGEHLPFAELKYIISRMAANTNLPISVDVEGGYSRDANQIVEHVKELSDYGIAGINIEDSAVTSTRSLLPAESFAKTLAVLTNQLNKSNIDLFVNVRIDTFLLSQAEPVQNTIFRMKHYEEAGADGLFIPCLTERSDILEITSNTKLPVNLLTVQGLPSLSELNALSIKRVSTGNFLYDKICSSLRSSMSQLLKDQDSASIWV